MCVNCRSIKNKYTGHVILVPCGKCPACQEQKALSRSNRIRNTYDGNNIALFVTLTYSNDFVPYIKKSDLPGYATADLQEIEVPVYRDAKCRRVRYNANYDMTKKIDYGEQIIDFQKFEIPWDFDPQNLRSLSNGDPDKVAIPYYKDIQDFQKRLWITLYRQGFREKLHYYQCNELGPTTIRTHHHALIFCRAKDVQVVRAAIVQAWPFGDLLRNKKRIQIARNAASYVAKYVNRDPVIPRFFASHYCRQKHSYSQGFGVGNYAFTFSEIEKAVNRGDLSYFVQRKVNGVPTTFNIPIPEYVVNRYFPKFKGYSRIAGDSVRELVSAIIRSAECKEVRYYSDRCIVKDCYNPLNSYPLDYANSDYHLISCRLKNAYMRAKEFGFSGNVFDYSFLYERAWRTRFATVFRLSFDDVVTPDDNIGHYDNLYFLFQPVELFSDGQLFRFSQEKSRYRPIRNDTLLALCPNPNTLDFNPNHNPRRILQSSRLSDIYYKSFKKRKVSDFVENVLDVREYEQKLKLYNNETR